MPGEIEAIASILQTGVGIVQSISGNKKLKKLFKQRTAYQTPEELMKLVGQTQHNAAMGFDPKTLQYMTDNAGRNYSQGVGAATRLGADPNAIMGLNDQYMQNIMKIGGQDQMMKLQNFDRYFAAQQQLVASRDAEWQSKDNMIKDQMQAAAQQANAGEKNIESGFNSFIKTKAATDTANIWDKKRYANPFAEGE